MGMSGETGLDPHSIPHHLAWGNRREYPSFRGFSTLQQLLLLLLFVIFP